MTPNTSPLALKVAQLQFAAHELRLYLDTHPGDKKAAELFEDYNRELRRAADEYREACAPLTAFDPDTAAAWVKSPWPWEI
ncbi:MAG: spore coat protein CotJB [Clostridia bacterium]|nr:spore coat protein CotJB [Clostridia bacterium]